MAAERLAASARPDPLFDQLCARHAASSVVEAVISVCRSFVARHGGQHLPLRLDLLLRAAGARREARRLTSHGRLEIGPDGRFVVVVDARQHWSRQRFTIGHELAHILLFAEFVGDEEALRRLRSPELWPVVERACNAAAAELLMPDDDVAAVVARAGLDPKALSELHSRYAVSWSALLVRLTEVLRVPVAVFRHHARHLGETEQWRVHRLYGAGHGLWIPTGMTTRHLSVGIVEDAGARGQAEARLMIDVPHPTTVRAVASSLTRARAIPRQQGLFEQLAPDEPACWAEVAVFLYDQSDERWPDAGVPLGAAAPGGVESPADGPSSPTLALW